MSHRSSSAVRRFNGSWPCIIWAVTAMNENEIAEMVDDDCLNGISVKPLSKQKLS